MSEQEISILLFVILSSFVFLFLYFLLLSVLNMYKPKNHLKGCITFDEETGKEDAAVQNDGIPQKLSKHKSASEISRDSLHVAVDSKEIVIHKCDNLVATDNSLVKNRGNALMLAVLKCDRTEFNTIWHYLKKCGYYGKYKDGVDILRQLPFEDARAIRSIIDALNPSICRPMLKCNITWLMVNDDTFISEKEYASFSSEKVKKFGESGSTIIQSNISYGNVNNFSLGTCNDRGIIYNLNQTNWDAFLPPEFIAPETLKVSPPNRRSKYIPMTQQSHSQRHEPHSSDWNPYIEYDASECNGILADEQSLRNVFFNELPKPNLQFDESMLHKIHDIKELLIFIHSMLRKLQYIISPDNLIDFIVREYFVSTTSSKMKATEEGRIGEKQHGKMEDTSLCKCNSTFTVDSFNHIPKHRKRNLTKYSTSNEDMLDLKTVKYSNEIKLSTRIPPPPPPLFSAKIRTPFSKSLGHLPTTNRKIFGRKSKDNDAKSKPVFKTVQTSTKSQDNSLMEDKSPFETFNDSVEFLRDSKLLKKELCCGNFKKTHINSALEKCLVAMIIEFKRRETKTNHSNITNETSGDQPGKRQTIPREQNSSSKSGEQNRGDYVITEVKGTDFAPPAIAFIRLKRASRWYQVMMKLLRSFPSPMHQLSTWKGLVFFSSNFAYTLKDGTFGTYLGLLSDGLPVTVRSLKMKVSDEHVNNQRQLLSSKNSLHLTIFYDAVLYPSSRCLYVISELCEYNLQEYLLRSKTLLTLPTGELIRGKLLVHDFIGGLAYLHSLAEPLAHGHLKPSNLMITYNGRLKISDFYLLDHVPMKFGVIKEFSTVDEGFTDICWRPKELILAAETEYSRDVYAKAGDIQVAGMLVYHILSAGKHPFGRNDEECQENIAKGKHFLGAWLADVEARDIIQSMIQNNSLERIPMASAFEHPYLWNTEKKFRFLTAVGKAMISLKEKPLILFEHLTASCIEARDWVYYVHEPLLEFLNGRNKIYDSNLMDLLRFSIDLNETFDELPLEMKRSVKKPSEYIISNFPTILMSIYEVFRKCEAWQSQLTLTSFF